MKPVFARWLRAAARDAEAGFEAMAQSRRDMAHRYRRSRLGGRRVGSPPPTTSGHVTDDKPRVDARVWMVTELYRPELTSTGHYLSNIAEGLASRGREVVALCAQPNYAARGTTAPRRELLNGVDVRRCRSTRLPREVLPFRLLNVLTQSARFLLSLLGNLARRDVVMVVTNPPTLPIVAALACRVRSAQLVVLVHDVYPDVMWAAGVLSPSHPLSQVLDWCQRRALARAKLVLALSGDMQRRLVGRRLAEAGNVAVITNWADLDLVDAKARSPEPDLVVLYSGNLGRTHCLEDLLAAARAVEGQPIRFRIVGAGSRRKWLDAILRANPLVNVTVEQPVPFSDLSGSLSDCDIGFIGLIDQMAGVSAPSRLYNMLAAGRPVVFVGDASTDIAVLIAEFRIGWVVPPGEPDKLADTLVSISNSRETLPEIGVRARKLVEQRFRKSQIVDEYDRQLSPLLGA